MGVYNMIQIGSRIREFRQKKGLTQKFMAEQLRIHKGTYCNYENNHREPSEDTIKQISMLLDVSVDELLGINIEDQPNILLNIDDAVSMFGQMNYTVNKDDKSDWISLVNKFGKTETVWLLTINEFNKIKETVNAAVQLELFKMGKNPIQKNNQE